MTNQIPLVSRIAGVEIPVSDLRAAVEWYDRVLGLKVIGDFQESWKEAMLQFAHRPDGVPGIYLVQTDSSERLKFHNTNYGYTQSIIDFYSDDLPAFHRHLKTHGVTTNRDVVQLSAGEISGFGFFDPDGNSLGATNVVFAGK
ncbi:VOC family protein [Paenibacillus hemerocallicola]|uniref:VOC family protein n=1 Tax=Paenibacillus hemerocallicola TaxID=1172614 RepID=A0A5C4T474_9BACL|nr:VOC family protein [Paenibacillus hemerocallicola]TNJ63813.1 VOC family protein [Paenibacillus hemerocallicola]